MRCRGPATWVLGRHRLVCGDCTDQRTVEAALAGARPHLTTTDPPCGVAYDPAWRNRMARTATKRTGRVLNDARADWRERGRCSAARSPMSGTAPCTPRPWRRASRPAASSSGRRSSGPRTHSCSGAAITTGSMNPAGTACAPAATGTGKATAARRRSGRSRGASRTPPSRPRSGPSPAAASTPRRRTARRSRWSACRTCSTTAASISTADTRRTMPSSPAATSSFSTRCARS